MRSFNRARIIDIEEKGLDPSQNHVVGPDGRLASKEDKKEKSEKLDHPNHQKNNDEKDETTPDTTEQVSEQPQAEKKTKPKKVASKTS